MVKKKELLDLSNKEGWCYISNIKNSQKVLLENLKIK